MNPAPGRTEIYIEQGRKPKDMDRPWGFQEVEAPRFQDNQHLKAVRLSALRTDRLYPQEVFLALIMLEAEYTPRP